MKLFGLDDTLKEGEREKRKGKRRDKENRKINVSMELYTLIFIKIKHDN